MFHTLFLLAHPLPGHCRSALPSILPPAGADPLSLILHSACMWRSPLEPSPASDGGGAGEGWGSAFRSPESLRFSNAGLERQMENGGLGSNPSPTSVSSRDLFSHVHDGDNSFFSPYLYGLLLGPIKSYT